MRAIENSFRGLGLLVQLNWDRGLFIGSITLGLAAGAYLLPL